MPKHHHSADKDLETTLGQRNVKASSFAQKPEKNAMVVNVLFTWL
jgi:hypothetical protein